MEHETETDDSIGLPVYADAEDIQAYLDGLDTVEEVREVADFAAALRDAAIREAGWRTRHEVRGDGQ